MHPRLRVAAPALLLAAALLVPAGASAGPFNSTVSGVVLDPSGHPAAGVLVASIGADDLWRSPTHVDGARRQVLTDAKGHYTLAQPSGSYVVRACPSEGAGDELRCLDPEESPAYLRSYRTPTAQADSWIALPGLIPSSFVPRVLPSMRLTKPSAISGTLKNANVVSTRPDLPPELVVLRRLDGTQVSYRFLEDESGRYAFPGLAPGQYRVDSYMTQFSPRRFHSAIVTLLPGQSVRVNATLERTAQVVGTMTSKGRPVNGQQFDVLDGSTKVASGVTDDVGRFEARLPRAGRYVIRTVGYDTLFRPQSSKSFTVGGGAIAHLNLSLVQGSTITLHITSPGDGPLRDRLRDDVGRTVDGFRYENGEVRYTALAKGTYTVTVASNTHYVSRRITIADGKAYDLGSTTLTSKTLTLSGRTVPKSSLDVADHRDFLAERFGAELAETPFADSSGHYEIHGLMPGTYDLVVQPDTPTGPAPRVYADVHLTTDSRKDLPAPRGTVIKGRLVYAGDGKPVEVPLALDAVHTGANRPFQYSFTLSDRTGRFSIGALMDGPIELSTNVKEGAQHDYWEAGTPYYFEHDRLGVDVPLGRTVDIGAVRLTLRGGVPKQ